MHKWLPILLNAFDCVLLHYRTVKRLLIPILQIRVRNGKIVLLFLDQNICCWYLNGPIKWDGFLKPKSTLFNLLIRGTSHFLCYDRLLNMTYVAHKMHFSAKFNSGRIAIQWFHIKHYLDYQYTKFHLYLSGAKNVYFGTIRDFGSPTICIHIYLRNGGGGGGCNSLYLT